MLDAHSTEFEPTTANPVVCILTFCKFYIASLCSNDVLLFIDHRYA